MREGESQTPALGRRGFVSLFINLFWSATLSRVTEWSAASRAGRQFYSRTVFWATFGRKMLIRWYQDALWEHVNAIKAVSRSQTSARPPCLLPSWLAPWDSWALAPWPAAHLIFLYFVIVLFILLSFFPPPFSSLCFLSNVLTALENPLLPIRTSRVKSMYKSHNENNLYYNENEF